jgi:hypothetical protein
LDQALVLRAERTPVLAYVSWHRPAAAVERSAYERALVRFHRSLAARPPCGFRGSASARVDGVPWLAGGGYEDWYLLEDWAALGVLEEAAVSRGHRGAHDAAAKLAGSERAGVYRLLEGSADPARGEVAVWVDPVGARSRHALAELLGDGIDRDRDGVWRRCLALGPAPQYCVLAAEEPAGVAPARLPDGWTASTVERTALWHG